jgi:putative ABC transport system permease protein
MNVMLVTVSERTKEIGVIKAIGAKQSDILIQFLAEAVVLSVGGGVFGIILGQGLIPLLNTIDGFYVIHSLMGVVLAFSFSAIVGVVFGFYPACKGSKLDPVDALRSE